jgi:hypothetical protein
MLMIPTGMQSPDPVELGPRQGGKRARIHRVCLELARSIPATALGVALAAVLDRNLGNAAAAPLYIPVVVALAWTRGFPGAVLASCASAGFRALLDHGDHAGLLFESMVALGWSSLIRLIIYGSVGATVARLRQLVRERDQLVRELRAALDEASALRGLLPMCAWCKHIRDEQAGGAWVPIERYLAQKTATQVSHGICPPCAEKTFGSSPGEVADRPSAEDAHD